MNEEMINKAMTNDYEEAQEVVDSLIAQNNRLAIYKMYEVGKVLMKFLESEQNKNNKYANTVSDMLLKMMDFMTTKYEVQNVNK